MRAARFHSVGDPSVLTVEEVAAPAAPQGDRLLVGVAASSVNGTDLGLRRGGMRVATWGRMPFVPGFDAAGEVLACGPAVTAFEVGDPVMALLGHGGGGQAEQVLVAQTHAARAPGSVSLVEASTLPLAGLTALQALRRRAGLHQRPGARVLVLGASGGVGCYGVQLAKVYGAHVTAGTSPAKLEFVRELGADTALDTRSVDVTAGGEQWDVVLDCAGLLDAAGARRVLLPGGVVVSTRPASLDALRAIATDVWRRPRRRYTAVMTSASGQDLAHLAELVDSSRLRPVLDQVFELEMVAEAHRHAESGALRGKVTVTV